MKARLVKRKGSFAEAYYAVAVLRPSRYGDEIVLQCPAFQYPCGYSDMDTDRQEGLNDTAKDFFQSIVDKLNSD